MADFISRDEFAEHLADIQFGETPTGRTGENIDYQNGVCAGFDMAYVSLKQFPAADVKPVARAKWCDVGPDMTCSACGFSCDDPFYLGEANYCPNCGADMREDGTDG